MCNAAWCAPCTSVPLQWQCIHLGALYIQVFDLYLFTFYFKNFYNSLLHTVVQHSDQPFSLVVWLQLLGCKYIRVNYGTNGIMEIMAPGSESSIHSLELSLPGTLAPWNFRSWEYQLYG